MHFVAALGLVVISGTGRLQPEVKIDGQPASCKVQAISERGETSDTGVELAEGRYALRVECPHADGALIGFGPTLNVKAGQTINAKIELQTARLRVEARRNDVLLPADVRLSAPGSTTVLVEIPANQTKVVAAGRYDVWVVLKDKASPAAEALLANSQIGGKKTTIIAADLSDGTLIVGATNNGRSAAGSVRAFQSKEVALAETDQEMRLPAGRYKITTELRDSSDFATTEHEVWIRAGKVVRLSERFATGQLSVSVVQDGKPVDATVRLSKPGASDFFNYFPAPGTVSLTPGGYDLTIESKAAGPLERAQENNVSVRAGAMNKRIIDLTPASLTVRAVKNGATARAELEVRLAGGGETVPPDADGRWRLWPGSYEIRAQLEDGTEQVDGPFAVKLREKVARTIQFERASLTVRAHRGKALADDAEILVYRQGAAKPIAKGKSGAQLEIQPGIYDIKIVAGVDVVWQKDVKLKKTQVVDVDLPAKNEAIDDLPEGDLAPPSEELPEGDAEG